MTRAKNKFELRVPTKLDLTTVERMLRERSDIVCLEWTDRRGLMFSPRWSKEISITIQSRGHLEAWIPIQKDGGEAIRWIINLLLKLGAREEDTYRWEVHFRGDLVASLNGVVFRSGGAELSLKKLNKFEELWEIVVPRKLAEEWAVRGAR